MQYFQSAGKIRDVFTKQGDIFVLIHKKILEQANLDDLENNEKGQNEALVDQTGESQQSGQVRKL